MDQTAVIDKVSRRLKYLTNEQKTTRVSAAAPTISELLPLLINERSTDLVIECPLDEEKLFYLGQLIVILEVLSPGGKRTPLVRWFD